MTLLAGYQRALALTLDARTAILNDDLDTADEHLAARAGCLLPVKKSDQDAGTIAAILQQITTLDDECELLVKHRLAAILKERAAGQSGRKLFQGYNPSTAASRLEISA